MDSDENGILHNVKVIEEAESISIPSWQDEGDINSI